MDQTKEQQAKMEAQLMSILPPFMRNFLEVEVELINGQKKKIKELVHWDMRGYQQEAKDQSVNEKYDFWNDKKSGQWCMKHRALEKLADIMGIEILEETIDSHSQPTVDNRYQHIFTMTVADPKGRKATYVGEANNAGGGMVQNNYNAYPASMAFKRAFDRAIMKLIMKIARTEYLTRKDFEALKDDQEIHVDIESEEWLDKEAEKAGTVAELNPTQESELNDYFKAINAMDVQPPKSKTEKAMTDFECKIAESENKLSRMREYIQKQELADNQKNLLFAMIEQKQTSIDKVKKDYGFGTKQSKPEGQAKA